MILGILQARMSSTRLPGKVLAPVLGEPMLARQVERVRRATTLDGLIVATSVDSSDDPIQLLCETLEVSCFRGSLDDVLDRFYRAALESGSPDHVVRLTGDCPLSDPAIVDAVVGTHLEGGFDYTSNVIPPTFPDGLDVEVLRFDALEEAWGEAILPSEREHVTAFVHRQPERFCLGNLEHDPDLSALRWTVDEPEDLAFVRVVFERLYPLCPEFSMGDVLDLLRREAGLTAINQGFGRNEGFAKSLRNDALYM